MAVLAEYIMDSLLQYEQIMNVTFHHIQMEDGLHLTHHLHIRLNILKHVIELNWLRPQFLFLQKL